MDFFGTLLWPIRWVIELILVSAHKLFTSIGLNPNDGWTWLAAICVLVVVVRSALIPLIIKQIKSQRVMMEMAPEIKKIQKKYKGKRDQFSMQAMREEQQALYAKYGASPMSGCWPMLVQLPIFFGLFNVLQEAQHDKAGVGLMTQEIAHSFANAQVFGVPLKATLMNNSGNMTVIVVAVVVIIVMVASQFFTQLQLMSKNISQAAKESPMYKQQQIMLYILPFMFVFSGVVFPIGLMSYWLISNFWTMGQQYLVIRNMPTPGSEAYKKREDRLRRSGKWMDEPAEEVFDEKARIVRRESKQRNQPVSKNRSKKKRR